MKNPELFDVIELLVDLPAHNLSAGDSRSETLRERGAICGKYDHFQYEVEFTNTEGESIALVVLPLNFFVVVWRSASKTWVSIAEKIQALVSAIPEENLPKIFDFARSIHNERISI